MDPAVVTDDTPYRCDILLKPCAHDLGGVEHARPARSGERVRRAVRPERERVLFERGADFVTDRVRLCTRAPFAPPVIVIPPTPDPNGTFRARPNGAHGQSRGTKRPGCGIVTEQARVRADGTGATPATPRTFREGARKSSHGAIYNTDGRAGVPSARGAARTGGVARARDADAGRHPEDFVGEAVVDRIARGRVRVGPDHDAALELCRDNRRASTSPRDCSEECREETPAEDSHGHASSSMWARPCDRLVTTPTPR